MTLTVLLLAGHLLTVVFFCKDQRYSIAWLCQGVAQGLEQGLQPSPGRNNIADKGQLVDYVAFKKSVQITTSRKAVVSVASNLPRLWASTNVCVVR